MAEIVRPIPELLKHFQDGFEWTKIRTIGSIAILGPEEILGFDGACRTGFDYSVSAYPSVYGYGDFTMSVKAPGGVMARCSPRAAEFGRSNDAVILNSADEDTDGERINITARALPNISPESLLLPGDPGFELIDQMHASLANLEDPVERIASALSGARKINPESGLRGFQCITAKNVLTKTSGQLGYETVALYGVQIQDEDIRVKLRIAGEPGQSTTPDEKRLSNTVLEGRGLIYDSTGVRSFELSDDQLSLAANLHKEVLALY